MAAVQVDILESGAAPHEPPPEASGSKAKRAASSPPPPGPEIEIEREVTKRQIVQSITTVVVVILYMVFTLLRDRDSGVVVVDPEDGADDWQE